jgi:hypothetical protein
VPEEPISPESVLQEPLTPEQILERQDDQGFVSGLILIDTGDMIDGDLESVLDLLSERLVGSPLGMEIEYEATGVLDGSIVMRVTLDPAMVLETS